MATAESAADRRERVRQAVARSRDRAELLAKREGDLSSVDTGRLAVAQVQLLLDVAEMLADVQEQVLTLFEYVVRERKR